MARNSKEPDIRVLVGVEGNVGIDSGSGKLISNTLKTIAKNISGRETPHITFGVDFQKTSKKIYKQLSEITESIKLKPIDLHIRTNQSSIGTSVSTAKPNVAVLTEEKQGLADVAAQKRKDIELTKQQKKEVQAFLVEVGRLNNAQKSLNTSENFASKLGKPELLNKIPGLREDVGALNKQVQELYNSTNNGKNLGDVIDDDSFKTLAENIKEANKAVADLQRVATQENPIFVRNERIAKNSRDISDFTLSLEKFAKANDKFKGNSGAATEFERIKSAISDLERKNNLGEDIGVDLDKLKSKTNEWKSSLESAGLTGQTWFGKLQTQMAKLGVYFGASAVMMGAWRQIKNMTNNVIELDTAMTELKKVTDETDSTYSRFLDNAEVRAKKLGATLTDTVRSTADAARMGYSLKEAESLADTFNIYRNVGDGIKDIEQASSTVISTMKAFGIEAQNSMQIVDAYNEVSNNFAVRSDEIGLAVADMGAAFAGAGNSMEEAIAVYTGMNEIIQDWSKSSTAMRTIAARLRNTAGELEELGVDSEGAAESVTKLQTQLLNLTKGKVDIMASPNEFKNTTQILRELSAVWDELSDKDRADVTRLVAGTRQQSTLQAVLTNWEQVEAAIITAMDSESSAYIENEKYLESVRGKAAQFQAQYEALSNTIINSDLIKLTYDSGTGLLGFLDGVINNLGSIPTLAAVAAGSISAFTNKGWLKILSDKRTYALYNLVETLNELLFSKRLYGNTSKWFIAKAISSVDNNTDGKVLLIA